MALISSSFGGAVRGFGRTLPAPLVSLPDYEILTFVGNNGCLDVQRNGTTNVRAYKYQCGQGWDSQVYVNTPFTAPVTLEFTKNADQFDNGASYAMISLNEDPAADASYGSLDYAAYPYRSDAYSVYHNATQVQFGGLFNTSSTFYIVYRTDGQLLHYNGSTLLFSVAWGAGRTVYVDTSFYSVNSTYSNFDNIRVRRATWNGTAYV